MTIILNGSKNSSYQEPTSVNGLLSSLNLVNVPVLVELNGTALRKSEFSSTSITDGAVIEIIQIAAGG
jgi:thiamine biosynthesis protein ThiS